MNAYQCSDHQGPKVQLLQCSDRYHNLLGCCFFLSNDSTESIIFLPITDVGTKELSFRGICPSVPRGRDGGGGYLLSRQVLSQGGSGERGGEGGGYPSQVTLPSPPQLGMVWVEGGRFKLIVGTVRDNCRHVDNYYFDKSLHRNSIVLGWYTPFPWCCLRLPKDIILQIKICQFCQWNMFTKHGIPLIPLSTQVHPALTPLSTNA